MSFRWTKSKTFEPAEMTSGAPPFGKIAPEVCEVHPRCFKAVTNCEGVWSMRSPLSLASYLPGTKRKLLGLTVQGMYIGDLGIGGWDYKANVRLVPDGVITNTFEFGNDIRVQSWKTVEIKDLNLSLDNVLVFDLQLGQLMTVGFPSTFGAQHVANIKADFEYYTNIAPVTCTVRLSMKNQQTGKPVSGAYVALMSGTRVVAAANSVNGEVNLNNIPQGSYTVRVQANGYFQLEQSVDVTPPSNWYDITLVPQPVIPMSAWTTALIVGVGGLGGLMVASSLLKRRGGEQIVVVR